MMKVLHLNTFDIKGGAARAAYRLHWGLRLAEVDSRMLVQRKKSRDVTVTGPDTKSGRAWGYLKELIDILPLKLYGNRKNVPLSPGWLPGNISKTIHKLNPDIIQLHWVVGGFLPLKELVKLNRPIVWTLHDMWAFTGVCHYTGECERYTAACGKCPMLNSTKENDLSHKAWERKKKAFTGLNLTIVTPSQWLAQCARKSSLLKDFRIEVIPNGLKLDVFKPIDKTVARQELSLSPDKKYILFGAISSTSDRRKGFHLLHPALRYLSENHDMKDVELLVFGASEPENPPDFGLPTRYLGTVNDDEKLALLYGASDVCVTPSLQDNLPNIVVETLACGTPCVAFNIGGMPDMIEHQKNGYLAQPFDPEDLAEGIAQILRDDPVRLTTHARKKAEETFDVKLAAKHYRKLYEELINI